MKGEALVVLLVFVNDINLCVRGCDCLSVSEIVRLERFREARFSKSVEMNKLNKKEVI